MTKSHWLFKALGSVNPLTLIGGIASLTITATALYFGIKMELALMQRDIADIQRTLAVIQSQLRYRPSPYGSSPSVARKRDPEEV